jgi:hypothetical protein
MRQGGGSAVAAFAAAHSGRDAAPGTFGHGQVVALDNVRTIAGLCIPCARAGHRRPEALPKPGGLIQSPHKLRRRSHGMPQSRYRLL